MWPDQVSKPGPLTYESGALPTGLFKTNVLLKFQTLISEISHFQILMFDLVIKHLTS